MGGGEEYDEPGTVHPHVCGDNGSGYGSICTVVRFTPTCVGTIHRCLVQFLRFPVHPHVCGDNCGQSARSADLYGSPPRVWGQYVRVSAGSGCQRFTPTCVGTIPAIAANYPTRSVHPHVCGDNDGRGIVEDDTLGSPPRVWGQLLEHRADGAPYRFTPTCVGTMICVRRSFEAVCGSPPRVWGQCGLRPAFLLCYRFTPTCVGTM